VNHPFCRDSLAQNASCIEPVGPPIVDGSTVTRDGLVANIGLVKKFIADSDQYQECLGNAFKIRKADADKSQVALDPSIKVDMLAKVDANQKVKEKRVFRESSG
jgi:hypothetical protein